MNSGNTLLKYSIEKKCESLVDLLDHGMKIDTSVRRFCRYYETRGPYREGQYMATVENNNPFKTDSLQANRMTYACQSSCKKQVVVSFSCVKVLHEVQKHGAI